MNDGEDIRPAEEIPAEAAPPTAEPVCDDSEENGTMAVHQKSTNGYFRAMIDKNFLEYASYVIGSRAIPDVDDGLKPVQRRIMWTLYQIYDNGRPTKTANVIGNAMHYHPHGDASIGDAIVVLANKGGCVEKIETDPKTRESKSFFYNIPYFIHKEGNFGNIISGSPAAAPRYTECALTRLAYETMFNNDITDFVPNYDGRKKEPTLLPAKIPALLMLGSDGIAVGMSTTVLPHNFNELIDAEIAELRGEEFHLFPDFQQGGVMDVREYDDGNGKITLRAKIDIEGRDLIIREIPATCDTKSLMASIKRAADKNKIRISTMDDFSTDHVEIRLTPTRGYDPEKTRQGLFMYTDCAVSISPKLIVLKEHRPVQMSVTEVLKRNVQKLLEYLRREFEIELDRLNEQRHAKTLAQLFFENRIYKRIEECKDQEEEYREVQEGLAPFRKQLLRDISNEDIDKLLALPVRRIARFDIEKNERELRDIAARIKEVKHHLANLVEFAIGYLSELKKKYGADFPRRTEIENFEQIDRKQAALNNIKIGWDRKNGYIGTAVKSDDVVVCNEFDRFVCTVKSGEYQVIALPPEKLYIGRMYDFRRYDDKGVFGIVYRDKKTGKFYGKRSSVGGYILEKKYRFCPEGCQLELLTPRADAIYRMLTVDGKGKEAEEELNLMELPLRSPKARGVLISGKTVSKLTHLRYLTEEEMTAFAAAEPAAAEETPPNDSAVQEEKNDGADNSDALQKQTETAVQAAAAPGQEKNITEEIAENTVASAGSGETAAAIKDNAAGETENAEDTAATEDNAAEETNTAENVSENSSAAAGESDAAESVKNTPATGEDAPQESIAGEEAETDAAEVAAGDESFELDSVQDNSARRKTSAAKPKKPASPTPPQDEENFGIVQPEFGF